MALIVKPHAAKNLPMLPTMTSSTMYNGRRNMLTEKFISQKNLHVIGRIVSLIVLMSVIGALILSYIKLSGSRTEPPPPARTAGPGRNITAIAEGYEFVSRANGKPRIRLTAERDITYEDGHHELEMLTLVSYSPEGREEATIRADRGLYDQQQGLATFTGNVVVKNADGLEVRSEQLSYNQHTQVSNTDHAVSFSYGAINGTSVGGVVHARDRTIALQKDAVLIVTPAQPSASSAPLEIRGQKASFAQIDGIARFEGQASVTQGSLSGRADTLTGVFTRADGPEARVAKLIRVEARGSSHLQSREQGRSSELQSRDMDFHFDEAQRLKLAGAWGGASARSLEKDGPREISAEKIEAQYQPGTGGSNLSVITTQGRTTMKIVPPEGEPAGPRAAERLLEADTVEMHFHPDGKYLSRAAASGNAVLTVTPAVITPQSDRQRLRAPKFTADFFATGNLLRSFVAETGTSAEFEPLQPRRPDGSERPARTLTGNRLTAQFDEQTQEVTTLSQTGNTRFTEGERQATAASAVYTAADETVALRGKPQIWDNTLRVSAEQIDARTGIDESFARGRVRTTYYSRETTNGAAPFKKPQAPVFIASERAHVKHREGVARYEGNARAWQDDNFVRAGTIELDRNERMMIAVGDVHSALYSVERATDQTGSDKTREVIPIFATAEQMHYSDLTRVVRYNGRVNIKQGTDQIEAASAEAKLDDENRLERMTATTNVVLTQPFRRGTGDQAEYVAASDTVILTGSSARVEDRERDTVTTGAKLTLHLRDARIQAADERGSRRVRTTHRIRPQ